MISLRITKLRMELKNTQTSFGPVSYRRVGNGPRKAFYFHGFPSSSAEIRIFEHFADAIGLEIICFDRPGYNDTRIKTSTMLDATVGITIELSQQHAWKTFEVVATSGGTPYGLHVAGRFPKQVKAVRVICGLGNIADPKVRKYFPKASYIAMKALPHISGNIINAALNLTLNNQDPQQRSPLMQFFFPSSTADDKCILETGAAPHLRANLLEAMKQGGLGPKQDARVYTADWGSQLGRLEMPVAFWHGDDDKIVPHRISEFNSSMIKNSRYERVPNEGHMSLPILFAEKIMRTELETTV